MEGKEKKKEAREGREERKGKEEKGRFKTYSLLCFFTLLGKL